MKIVIDIDEKTYDDFMYYWVKDSDILRAVRNGTPIDLDGLKSDMKALNCGYPYGLDYLLDCLDKRLGITIREEN